MDQVRNRVIATIDRSLGADEICPWCGIESDAVRFHEGGLKYGSINARTSKLADEPR